MKLGARMIKTGIAVVLALYIGEWFDLQPVFFIVFAAVVATQPSIFRSFRYFLEQLQANFIGAILGFAAVMLIGKEPIVIGLVVIIVIIINLLLKLEKSISLSILTVIIVMQAEVPEEALNRFILIMIGIFISIVVNAAFIPPNHERNLLAQLNMLNDRVLLLLRNIVEGLFDEKSLRKEKGQIVDELKKAEELFSLYKEERTLNRKKRRKKRYTLVIYRQMLSILAKEVEIIHSYKRNEEHEADEQVHQCIMALTQYNELIYLKLEGKIRINHKHELNAKVSERIEKLMKHILQSYDKNTLQQPPIYLIINAGQFSELAHKLDHLDTLVTSYNRFHML